jgi:hypothetical protein
MSEMKINQKKIEKWKIFSCYSDRLGWIEKDVQVANSAYSISVITENDFLNKNTNPLNFDYKIDIFCSMACNPDEILGENKEKISSIKLFYHPSFIIDKSNFNYYVWTSLEADEEDYNNLYN